MAIQDYIETGVYAGGRLAAIINRFNICSDDQLLVYYAFNLMYHLGIAHDQNMISV